MLPVIAMATPVSASFLPAPESVIVFADEVSSIFGPLAMPRHCEFVTPYIRDHGVWEPEESLALQSLIRPGMTVLDIGAHAGFHTVLAAHAVGRHGHVVSFEPSPENYALLRHNAKTLDLPQVIAINAAAWRATEPGVLVLSTNNSGDNRVIPMADSDHVEQVEIERVAIDDVLVADAQVDVVKIDVQGVERDAISGMERTIQRCRPAMLVEFSPEDIVTAGGYPEDVLSYYMELGYSLRPLGGVGFPIIPDPSALIEDALSRPGRYSNLLLLPA